MKAKVEKLDELVREEDLETLMREIGEFSPSNITDDKIPESLEKYLEYVARTGNVLYPWHLVRQLFRFKMLYAIEKFNDEPCNNEAFILERFDSFLSAPFTIQRFTELITQPERHYKKKEKFLRGLEKTVSVVSTVEHRPFHNEEVNGDADAHDSSDMLNQSNEEFSTSTTGGIVTTTGSPSICTRNGNEVSQATTETIGGIIMDKPNVEENDSSSVVEVSDSPIGEFVAVQEFREEVVESVDCISQEVPMEVEEDKMETYIIVDEVKCGSDSDSSEDEDESSSSKSKKPRLSTDSEDEPKIQPEQVSLEKESTTTTTDEAPVIAVALEASAGQVPEEFVVIETVSGDGDVENLPETAEASESETLPVVEAVQEAVVSEKGDGREELAEVSEEPKVENEAK